ncbi:MAG: hypothetical protein SV598_14305, partial [Pseudomonadota bacterium]|nr:hypothetical protein [Pseudomonadota bacterium]
MKAHRLGALIVKESRELIRDPVTVALAVIMPLLVTPISTLELFLAKVTPTLIMGVLSIFPSLVIVRVFDVP